MSRAAVNPARRSACAFCTAINIALSVVVLGPRVLNM
jgi:hypothetical protein